MRIVAAGVAGIAFLAVVGATLAGTGAVTGACTGWFDGYWHSCCIQHDRDYATGVLKRDADIALAQCVSASGHPGIGLLMLTGVTVFGGAWYANARHTPA